MWLTRSNKEEKTNDIKAANYGISSIRNILWSFHRLWAWYLLSMFMFIVENVFRLMELKYLNWHLNIMIYVWNLSKSSKPFRRTKYSRLITLLGSYIYLLMSYCFRAFQSKSLSRSGIERERVSAGERRSVRFFALTWYLTAVTEMLHEKCKCAKTWCRRTKSVVRDFEWFSEISMQIDALAELAFAFSLFCPRRFDDTVTVSFIANIWNGVIPFKLGKSRERQQNILHKNKEINKIFLRCWKSNIQYEIYGKFALFCKVFFFYYCIFICENGCRQSMANSLVSHKQRERTCFWIFLYFAYFCVVGAWCSFLKTFSAKIKCSALLKGSFYSNGNACCMFDKAFGSRIAKIWINLRPKQE